MEEDWYVVLSVPRRATADEIKHAYRELALIHHPDRNPGNAESARKFMRIKAAYKILNDPQERRIYDLEMEHRQRQAAARAKAAPLPPAPALPRRRRFADDRPPRPWSFGHVLIAVGALLAARGFLGVYTMGLTGFVERWVPIGGGPDRAFVMMLAGIALAVLGMGR